METNEWAAKAWYFLFQNMNLLPEGKGKQQVAQLLTDAPQTVKDAGAQILIEMEKNNG